MSDIKYLLNAFEEASQHADPASVGYGQKRKALLDRIAELERENEALRKDAERYRWLQDNVVEEPLDHRRFSAELLPDIRLKYKLPTLLSFNCIGCQISFDAAIDAAMLKAIISIDNGTYNPKIGG